MDLRRLRYFLAIVEGGSFTRAAAHLGVAQPALSLHVRRMEEALGTALLLRGPHGVTPTKAGEILMLRARLLLADLAQTEEEIRSIGGEPSGTVRLGLTGTISDILSVPLIMRCRTRHPAIKIIVAEAMSGFVREWLLEGRSDIAVLYTQLRETGFRSEALLDEELVLLQPPGVGEGSEASLTVLAEQPLILPSGTHGLRLELQARLREAGIVVDPVLEVDSYANIKRLVEAGHGCSVLPYHAVAPEAREGRLTVRRFTGPRLWRSAWLVHATARPVTRAVQAVDATLREVVSELITKRCWAGACSPGERAGVD